jgi:hypothetical protein
VHHDFCLAERSLDRLLGAEDLGQLFERATARLDVEEVDEGELENVPEDEEEVVLQNKSVIKFKC